jgi:hypothetical protein
MFLKILSILVLTLSPTFAEFNDLTFGTGVINEHIGRFQTNRGGDTNDFDHRVYFNLGTQYQLFENISLVPEFGLLWPFGTTDDENTHKYSYFFNGHLAYSFLERYMISLGTGMYLTTIKGDGGTATLPNGDGYTSFPVPNGASTTRNIVAILGGQSFIFKKEWSVKAQVYAFNVLSSLNRSFSYTLSVQYHFGDSLWK